MTNEPKDSYQPGTIKATPPVDKVWKNGLYEGKELRPFDDRPGAMDAYKLPSKGIGA